MHPGFVSPVPLVLHQMEDVEGAAASFGAINGLLAASALTC